MVAPLGNSLNGEQCSSLACQHYHSYTLGNPTLTEHMFCWKLLCFIEQCPMSMTAVLSTGHSNTTLVWTEGREGEEDKELGFETLVQEVCLPEMSGLADDMIY